MIYTRCYGPVNLLTAEAVEERDRRGDTFTQYYVTAELAAPYQDGSGRVGEPILDGQQFPAYELRADDGWREVMDAIFSMLPPLELEELEETAA